jgi:hypothetical protein
MASRQRVVVVVVLEVVVAAVFVVEGAVAVEVAPHSKKYI